MSKESLFRFFTRRIPKSSKGIEIAIPCADKKEKKIAQNDFTLRIKEKALSVRMKEKERLERELQSNIEKLEVAQAVALKAQEDLKKEARTFELLRSVAATANRSFDIDEAITTVLNLMCAYMECALGHAYMRDPQDAVLRSTKLWCVRDKENLQGFIDVSEKLTYKVGVGLPGLVWEKRTPVRIACLASVQNLPRLQLCPNAPVKSGFSFPLIVDKEVAYVLEFFFTRITEIPEEFQMVLQDIGNQLVQVIERARAREMLQRAKEAAENANVAKSEFLANMSHELRTPLSSIIGMIQLLNEKGLGEEEKALANMAFLASTNLLEIVNDILDLSKIEAGEMKLEHIGFDPHYILRSMCFALETLAKEKNILLKKNFNKDTFPYLLGDPVRFNRILTNLVSNAIKYTDKGSVEIYAYYRMIDENRLNFSCEIKDTGIGVPKERQRQIFEKFVQADASTTRRYGGTGLGLAITKQLVELMGGSISVESEVGVGSTFKFTIPFEITDELNKEKITRQEKRMRGVIPTQTARLLVAEDHPLNKILIGKILSRFGIGAFEVVENGEAVLKRYREGVWDVILMDCHMPGKDGYETAKEIRRLEGGTGKHIPIVAMTASAMIGDREKCLCNGMDDYISKPIDLDELKDVLGQWLYFKATGHEVKVIKKDAC